jgi:hemolysin III
MHHGERFNSITHLAGLGLALVGSVVLLQKASASGNSWMQASSAIFAVTMVLLYAASSLYHSTRGAAKEVWAKVDHCAIYLLIAGTYTPFTLVTLHGTWGWALFGVVWALAGIGIIKELWVGRETIPSLPLYVLMGWAALAAAVPLVQRLPGQGLGWLLLGGVLYTLGIPFYVKSDHWRHAHGVWHLFVLGGTAAHFFTVFNFVV